MITHATGKFELQLVWVSVVFRYVCTADEISPEWPTRSKPKKGSTGILIRPNLVKECPFFLILGHI
jgi:hypothetical protein